MMKQKSPVFSLSPTDKKAPNKNYKSWRKRMTISLILLTLTAKRLVGIWSATIVTSGIVSKPSSITK